MQNSKEEQKDRRGEEEMRGGGEGNSEGQENGGKGEQGGVDNGEGSGLLKVTEVKEEARTSIEREDEIREQGKENEIGVEENREADREGWEICRGKGKGAEDNRAVEENRQRTGMGEDNTNEADEKEENTERGQDTREGMEEDTGGADGILEDEERVTTGTQEHEEHGEGQTKDDWRADHCHSDGDYRSEMDLNGSVSPMQHELATLPTLRHDQQDEGVIFDDEARYNKDDGFADCGDDCQDKGEQRTHSSAFDAGDNAQALLPGSVVCEVSSASMPEGYPEESQLRSFDPPVAASGGERCRSIDVLEIMLSEHSEAGSTEEEPMGKSVAKVKRRKTDGLQNNRASKNHVDRGDENADASVVKPAVRTYKKAAARRTKVKKTHGEHGGDENYEITRMMIVKAELSELRDFSQELVSLELSETEFTDILYPRSRCGWTRSSRGGNLEGENREEQSSTGGNHDQTLYPSSLGQHDALCNKLLEAAKQHIVDLDLKKCNITYKWNDSCTYVGVLGAKNNSQKYQRSDQAWYNVTWDDGSKAQVLLESPLCHVALKEHHRSILRNKEPKSWCLDPPSVVQRFFTLVLQETSEKSPVPRGNAFQAYEGFNALANDCTGEKLRGRKHGLNDKSFHGTNSVLQSPVKQEDAHPAAAGAVVPGSHAVGLWGCRAVDLASQGRRLTDVLTSTASASDQDKLTGESREGDFAKEKFVMLGDFLSLRNDMGEEARKGKKHCEICKSKDGLLQFCPCGEEERRASQELTVPAAGLTVHLDCYLGDFPDKEASMRAIAQVGFKCDPCCYGIEQEDRSCVLCPQGKLGALRPTSDGRWAHVNCARFLPALNNGRDEISGLDKLELARWNHECYLCGTKSGWCLTCEEESCLNHFHVGCALRLTKRSLNASILCNAAEGRKVVCGGHNRK